MANENETKKLKGFYMRGSTWWTRVRDPLTRKTVLRSTGMSGEAMALRVRTMLDELTEDRVGGHEWLGKIVAGDVQLCDVYNYRARGALHELREKLDCATREAAGNETDPDLRPLAVQWINGELPTRVSKRRRPYPPRQQQDMARQLYALIPEVGLPCSELTEKYVIRTLRDLEVSASTQRNYAGTWRMFTRWARRHKAPIPTDPFEFESDWLPAAAESRMTVWSHAERMAVLAQMHGEQKAAIALSLGSGMELSALLRLRGKDVARDGSRVVFADGTKTDYRSRYVFVDEWAWSIFEENTPSVIGNAKVFSWTEESKGNTLRDNFYKAQVRAGVCDAAPKRNGEDLWGQVPVHTIHDCRHTYAVCRGLGLDGEAARGNEYIASQLGHANEVMTTRVYKKLGSVRRQQLIAEAERLGLRRSA